VSGNRIKAGNVRGLDDFRRSLKALAEPELVDRLKDLNFRVAQHVISAAQAKASTPMLRKAMASLSPSRQAARAQVVGGGNKFPGFGGAEFGAQRNQRRTGPSGRTFTGLNQFEPWRGNGAGAGYALYPAIRSEMDEIVDMFGDEMERISRDAFPDGGT
jgi:hypothetical protein